MEEWHFSRMTTLHHYVQVEERALRKCFNHRGRRLFGFTGLKQTVDSLVIIRNVCVFRVQLTQN